MSEKWNDNDIDELLRDIEKLFVNDNEDLTAIEEAEEEPVAEAVPEPEIVVEEVVIEEPVAKPQREKREKPHRSERPERSERPRKRNHHVPVVLAVLFAIVSFGVMGWAAVTLHTADATVTTSSDKDTRKTVDLVSRFNKYVYNTKSDAVSDLTYIRKIYSLEENITVAPKPNPACYGETSDPAVIRQLIERSAELLDGQETLWNESIVPVYGTYRYYMDDTILVITWKEIINGKCCTCVEVKIADASQLRRKLTADTYDSGIRTTAREMAAQANAVIAMNADFYAYRNRGITVYQRQLYRCEGELLDTCFFNSKGEMLFVHAGQIMDRWTAEQYIADNDILFSASFGPVLIEHGVPKDIGWYAIGEIRDEYSRAAMGWLDDLHYFYTTISFDGGIDKVATIYELQDIMMLKGCYEAYTMDGGQTAEICMQGDILNHIDYGSERQVSDIIYFATAIPELTETEEGEGES